MKTLVPARVFEDVVQEIRLKIAKGKIKPNQRIPSSQELADQYKVGRGSIREAIRVLELIGLVEVRRGRHGGVFCRSEAPELARASFTPLANLRASFSDAIDFRKALEPKAASLAAKRASSEDIGKLRKSISIMEANLKSGERFVESNLAFHEAIATASKNPYFQDCIPAFLSEPEILDAALSSELIERTLTCFFHKRIMEAIERRKSDLAEFWMMGHLSQIEEDLAHAQDLAASRKRRHGRVASRKRK